MKSIKKAVLSTSIVPMLLFASSCSASNATDYSNNNNWALKRVSPNANYDLLFFVGTSVMEQNLDNGVGNISESMKTLGLQNYTTVGAQLSSVKSTKKNGYQANVFVPMYRQMSLNYCLQNYSKHNEIFDDIKTKEPGIDLKASLDYYFTNLNKNGERPFVIAGHSQGGASIQAMFETYFINGGHKAYLKNCVAMYSVGFGVSKKWFNGLDKTYEGKESFHLATGATDTNCMISWNTEGPGATEGSMLLCDDEYDTYVINPLNWKTDATPASKDENLGVLIDNPNYDPTNPYTPKKVVSTKESDKFDAYLDLKRGSVIVSEPHIGEYVNIPPYGAIWGGKSLHTWDGAGFYINMARNLGDRLDAWFAKK